MQLFLSFQGLIIHSILYFFNDIQLHSGHKYNISTWNAPYVSVILAFSFSKWHNITNLTTGVRTCCSTGLLLRVLYTINVSRHTDSSMATNPKSTPAVNHRRKNFGFHWPMRTNIRLKHFVYHRSWPMDTEMPLRSRNSMYGRANHLWVWNKINLVFNSEKYIKHFTY